MMALDGLRVVDQTQVMAGPTCSMLLADMGADVIKVEPPGGEHMRRGELELAPGLSASFLAVNRGKRGMTLDLKHPDGRQAFLALVQTADAVLDNLRGDLPEKLGLTYEHLKDANPRIVCAHLSAYGRSGSRKAWPGYDYLMQAEAGFFSVTGEPDSPPTRFGLSIVDFITGTMMAVGLLAALLDAQRSGLGRDVDVDLLSAAIHQTSYPAMWYLNAGAITGRTSRSAHPSVTPSQMFRTADGWVFVMAQIPKFWTVLVEKLGKPELASDPRFAKPADRRRHRDELVAILDAAFSEQPTAHWIRLLGGHMPVAPVLSLDQALDNPYLRTTGMIDTVPHPDRDDLRVLANPIKLDGQRLPNRAGPLLGSDTDDVLAAAGYDEGAIAQFRSKRVI